MKQKDSFAAYIYMPELASGEAVEVCMDWPYPGD